MSKEVVIAKGEIRWVEYYVEKKYGQRINRESIGKSGTLIFREEPDDQSYTG